MFDSRTFVRCLLTVIIRKPGEGPEEEFLWGILHFAKTDVQDELKQFYSSNEIEGLKVNRIPVRAKFRAGIFKRKSRGGVSDWLIFLGSPLEDQAGEDQRKGRGRKDSNYRVIHAVDG